MSLDLLVYSTWWKFLRQPGGLIVRGICMHERLIAETTDRLEYFKTLHVVDHFDIQSVLSHFVQAIDHAKAAVEGLRNCEAALTELVTVLIGQRSRS